MATTNDPKVAGPHSDLEGTYTLGSEPAGLVVHNEVSWRIVKAILDAYGEADFWDLAVACRGHRHYGRADSGRPPQAFIEYCIERKWLKKKA